MLYEVITLLAPLQDLPYIVFHDAYQSFERHYNLHPVGAIAVDPERRPGAKRLQQIRELLLGSGALCLFREPQFEPRYVPLLTEGTSVRTGRITSYNVCYTKLLRSDPSPAPATAWPGPGAACRLFRREK